MNQPIRIVAIAVLLTLFQLHDANADIQFSSHLYPYPNTFTIHGYNAFEGDILTYASCKLFERDDREKSCTIIQHKYPFDKVTQSCNVTLQKKYSENNRIGSYVPVQPFGYKNAILKWNEEGSRPASYLTIIQLDSCKTKTIEFDESIQQALNSGIVTYDDFMDVFIKDMKLANGSTGSLVRMRISFDQETQQIFNIKHRQDVWLHDSISSVDTHSPSKGYVHQINDAANFEYGPTVLIKPDDSEKVLVTEPPKIYNRVLSAGGNNLITSCAQPGYADQVKCTQYDENGEVKFKVNIGDIDQWEIRPDALYNTPGGGFFLKETKYKKTNGQRDSWVPETQDLLRINSEGKIEGSISLERFYQELAWSRVHFFKNGDQYCVTTISEDGSPRDIKLLTICFTENDISA